MEGLSLLSCSVVLAISSIVVTATGTWVSGKLPLLLLLLLLLLLVLLLLLLLLLLLTAGAAGTAGR